MEFELIRTIQQRVNRNFNTNYCYNEVLTILSECLTEFNTLSILWTFAERTYVQNPIKSNATFSDFYSKAIESIKEIAMCSSETAALHLLSKSLDVSVAINSILDNEKCVTLFDGIDVIELKNNVQHSLMNEFIGFSPTGLTNDSMSTSPDDTSSSAVKWNVIKCCFDETDWMIPYDEYECCLNTRLHTYDSEDEFTLFPRLSIHEWLADVSGLLQTLAATTILNECKRLESLKKMNSILRDFMAINPKAITPDCHIYLFRSIASFIRVTSVLVASIEEFMESLIDPLMETVTTVFNSKAPLYELLDYRPNYDFYAEGNLETITSLPIKKMDYFKEGILITIFVESEDLTYFYSEVLNAFSETFGINSLPDFVVSLIGQNENFACKLLNIILKEILPFVQHDTFVAHLEATIMMLSQDVGMFIEKSKAGISVLETMLEISNLLNSRNISEQIADTIGLVFVNLLSNEDKSETIELIHNSLIRGSLSRELKTLRLILVSSNIESILNSELNVDKNIVSKLKYLLQFIDKTASMEEYSGQMENAPYSTDADLPLCDSSTFLEKLEYYFRMFKKKLANEPFKNLKELYCTKREMILFIQRTLKENKSEYVEAINETLSQIELSLANENHPLISQINIDTYVDIVFVALNQLNTQDVQVLIKGNATDFILFLFSLPIKMIANYEAMADTQANYEIRDQKEAYRSSEFSKQRLFCKLFITLENLLRFIYSEKSQVDIIIKHVPEFIELVLSIDAMRIYDKWAKMALNKLIRIILENENSEILFDKAIASPTTEDALRIIRSKEDNSEQEYSHLIVDLCISEDLDNRVAAENQLQCKMMTEMYSHSNEAFLGAVLAQMDFEFLFCWKCLSLDAAPIRRETLFFPRENYEHLFRIIQLIRTFLKLCNMQCSGIYDGFHRTMRMTSRVIIYEDDEHHLNYISIQDECSLEKAASIVRKSHNINDDIQIGFSTCHMQDNPKIVSNGIDFNHILCEQVTVVTYKKQLDTAVSDAKFASNIAFPTSIPNLHEVLLHIQQLETELFSDPTHRRLVIYCGEILELLPIHPKVAMKIIDGISAGEWNLFFGDEVACGNLQYFIETLVVLLNPLANKKIDIDDSILENFRDMFYALGGVEGLCRIKKSSNNVVSNSIKLKVVGGLTKILFDRKTSTQDKTSLDIDNKLVSVCNVFWSLVHNELKPRRAYCLEKWESSVCAICSFCISTIEHMQKMSSLLSKFKHAVDEVRRCNLDLIAGTLNIYTLFLNTLLNSNDNFEGESFQSVMVNQLLNPSTFLVQSMNCAFLYRLYISDQISLQRHVCTIMSFFFVELVKLDQKEKRGEYERHCQSIQLIAVMITKSYTTFQSYISHHIILELLDNIYLDYIDRICPLIAKNFTGNGAEYKTLANYTLCILQLSTAAISYFPKHHISKSNFFEFLIETIANIVLPKDFRADVFEGDPEELIQCPYSFHLIHHKSISAQFLNLIDCCSINSQELDRIVSCVMQQEFLDQMYGKGSKKLKFSDRFLLDSKGDENVPFFRKRKSKDSEVASLSKRTRPLLSQGLGGYLTPNVPRTDASLADLVGLINPNTMCFANSVIQILLCIGSLVDYLTSIDLDADGFTPLRIIQELLATLTSRSGSLGRIYGPGILWYHFKMHKYAKPVVQCDQQDAVEFFTYFGEKLDERLATLGMHEPFKGLFENDTIEVYECLSCRSSRKFCDKFRVLGLSVKYDSITESMDEYFSSSTISDVTCDKCKETCDHKKKTFIGRSSPYLCVQLLRFAILTFDDDYSKDEANVVVPKNLSIKPYLKEPCQNNDDNSEDILSEYELFAYVVHMGHRKSGHYLSHVNGKFIKISPNHRKCENEWVVFNDSAVYYHPEDDDSRIADEKPYMVIYKAKEIEHNKSVDEWIKRSTPLSYRMERVSTILTQIESLKEKERELYATSEEKDYLLENVPISQEKKLFTYDEASVINDEIKWFTYKCPDVFISRKMVRKILGNNDHFDILLEKIFERTLMSDGCTECCSDARYCDNIALYLANELINNLERMRQVPSASVYRGAKRSLRCCIAEKMVSYLLGIGEKGAGLLGNILYSTFDNDRQLYLLATLCWALLNCETRLVFEAILLILTDIQCLTDDATRNSISVLKLIRCLVRSESFDWNFDEIVKIDQHLIHQAYPIAMHSKSDSAKCPDLASFFYYVLDTSIGSLDSVLAVFEDDTGQLQFLAEFSYILMTYIDSLHSFRCAKTDKIGAESFVLKTSRKYPNFSMFFIAGFTESLYNLSMTRSSSLVKIRILKSLFENCDDTNLKDVVKYLLNNPLHGIFTKFHTDSYSLSDTFKFISVLILNICIEHLMIDDECTKNNVKNILISVSKKDNIKEIDPQFSELDFEFKKIHSKYEHLFDDKEMQQIS